MHKWQDLLNYSTYEFKFIFFGPVNPHRYFKLSSNHLHLDLVDDLICRDLAVIQLLKLAMNDLKGTKAYRIILVSHFISNLSEMEANKKVLEK